MWHVQVLVGFPIVVPRKIQLVKLNIKTMEKTIKINFKELNLYSLSGEVKKMDTREAIGELIYSGTNGIGYKLLAEKIYKSGGEIELDENEVKLLVRLLDGDFFTNKLTDAIREHVK